MASFGLRAKLGDDDYGAASKSPNPDALNLASSAEHVEAMARCFELLHANNADSAMIEKSVKDLTSRNAYGAFSELSVYLWLLENKIPFEPQAAMTGADILNPNGSDLDGRMGLHSGVYFDVKGFGFRECLIKALNARLSKDFPNSFVAIEGNWDAPMAELSDLLSAKYDALRTELNAKQRAKRGGVDVTLRAPSPVQVTHNTSNPYELAEQNASYAFSYAKQFTRHAPFILVFVIHPWFSGGWLHNEFGGFILDFERAFARRTFLQFRNDATRIFSVSKGAAGGMLSGLAFFNAWRGQPAQPGAHFRLFINPLATNPISDLALDEFRFGFGAQHDLEIVRFDHDVY
ncbi:hypothetical protein U91I_03443 [alpha proteobacterium U9-1i]|nr:hypothetical protein U91I_03443 [alpha proteobacterium U9-1i]